jgi:7-cyano-7-deazaguanine reductase
MGEDKRMSNKLWESIDGSVLKSLPNAARGYEQKIKVPEFTFLGVHNQPDFGEIEIWYHGNAKTIELKSFKEYLFQYRDTIISYERTLDVLYKHMMEAYEPERLRIEIDFMPRGGIRSKMTVDSDWEHLGGKGEMWRFHGE